MTKFLKDFDDFLNSKEYKECEDTTDALKLLAAYHAWIKKQVESQLDKRLSF